MSYVLSVIGVTGLFVIGRGKWYGWLIAFLNECLWVTFALTTKQYGFLLGAGVYGTVNVYNATKWRKSRS